MDLLQHLNSPVVVIGILALVAIIAKQGVWLFALVTKRTPNQETNRALEKMIGGIAGLKASMEMMMKLNDNNSRNIVHAIERVENKVDRG